MGYTTKFTGKFALDRLPDAPTIVRLCELEDAEFIPDSPGGYCQWRLTKDCMGIEWDGGEKFYDYDAWLQWIIDTILTPSGLRLSGTVDYSGEVARDVGVLTIGPDGRVEKRELPAIRDEIEELKRFRDYVLDSDWAEEILNGWRRAEKRRQAQRVAQ